MNIALDIGKNTKKKDGHAIARGLDLLVISLLILGAILLYNFPKLFSVLAQVLVLLFYARSKKPHYWLAIYMFTAFNPGGLYHGQAPVLLSLIDVAGIGSVTFDMAFSAVTIYKSIGKKPEAYFKHYVIIFGIYMLLLIPIFGGKISYLLRGFLNYSWLLFLPELIKSEDDLSEIMRLLFLFNIVLLGMNIYQIISGVPFAHILSPSFRGQQAGRYLFREQDVGGLVRTSYGVHVAYLAMIGSLHYLTFKRSKFPQVWLYASLIIGIFNIVSSATRGWMIAVLFVVVGYSMFLVPRLFRSLVISAPLLVMVFFSFWQIPLVRHQLQKSYERFSTVEYLLEGDVSAGGTSSRHIRGARVMSKFSESPIIGFGFGPETMAYADGHTGNQTMLLYFGVLGYGIYILLWLVFMLKPIQLMGRIPARSPYRSLVWFPFFTLGGLIIIHSTSGMYLHPFNMGIFGAFVFTMGNLTYGEAKFLALKTKQKEAYLMAPQAITHIN